MSQDALFTFFTMASWFGYDRTFGEWKQRLFSNLQ